jgi:hypothetical protein
MMDMCEGCRFKKKNKELPCNHPIVREEMINVMGGNHLETARAYSRIRKRLGLKFKERSWTVIECKGREDDF